MVGWRGTGLVLVVALALATCSGGDDGGADPGGGGGAAPSTAPAPQLGELSDVSFDEPVTLAVENGTVVAADVVPEGGEPIEGAATEGGWVSDSPPLPGATYDVSVDVTDGNGAAHTLTGGFTVPEVPDDRRLTLSVVRGGGDVVGVGTPIIVKFDQAVEDRAAVEAALHVSSEPQVTGAWHWLSDQEVHFRPEEPWPAHTNIRADFELNGVQAGADLWGGRAYSYDIEVGDEVIAKADASSNPTLSVIRNGETVATWDTSMGAPDFATRNGIYVVQNKEREYTMSSCTANITCDPDEDGYYPEIDTEFAVRLTNSGTFVHAAPWSVDAQGRENVSHGCLNLSETDAEAFYDMVKYGDLVEVVGSTREATDLVERGDPGMADWNLTWPRLLENSEQGELTTGSL